MELRPLITLITFHIFRGLRRSSGANVGVDVAARAHFQQVF